MNSALQQVLSKIKAFGGLSPSNIGRQVSAIPQWGDQVVHNVVNDINRKIDPYRRDINYLKQFGLAEWLKNKETPGRYVQTPGPVVGTIEAEAKTISPTKAPIRVNSPTITPTPTMAPQGQYAHAIVVPGDNGKYEIPQTIIREGKSFSLPQLLMESFDDIKQATNAARMLKHPLEDTDLPGERERGVNLGPNRGENPSFLPSNIDVKNKVDGTIDRGIARINSGTFDEMSSKPYWQQRMRAAGINSWDDMNDPILNIRMARLVLEYSNWNNKNRAIRENPNWRWWYAAPRELRQGQ